jgi:hypothetical protein
LVLVWFVCGRKKYSLEVVPALVNHMSRCCIIPVFGWGLPDKTGNLLFFGLSAESNCAMKRQRREMASIKRADDWPEKGKKTVMAHASLSS